MRDDSSAVDLAPVATPCPPGSEWQLHDLVNAFRVRHGAWELPLSAELTRKAQAWSESMADSGVLAHSPLADGVSPGYTAVAENVALDVSVAGAEASFEQSSAHRANLLGAATEMGVGVSRDEHGRVWVAQLFAQRSVPTPPYRGPANSSAYHPIVPFVELRGSAAIDASVSLQVTGEGSIPIGATAVVATVTASGATNLGRLQVLLPDSTVGETSAVEFGPQGASVSTVLPLDTAGRLTLHASVPVHLSVIVSGAFVPTGGPTSDGRFTPVDAVRLGSFSVAAGSPTSVGVIGTGGVPGTGVLAVALGVHALDDVAVNVDGVPAAGLVIAPVAADGTIDLDIPANAAPTTVTVDLAGWFTDSSAPATTSGLFVPITPGRFLDSRTGSEPVAGGRRVYVPGRHDVGACPRAVAATLTIVPGSASSAAQLGPMDGFAAGQVPTVLSVTPKVPVSATALVATGEGSDLGVFTSEPAEVMVDLVGWFL